MWCAGSICPSAMCSGARGMTSCVASTTRPINVEVALVGKYVDLPDAYLSVSEALRAGGFHHNAKVNIRWVASDTCQTEEGAEQALGGVDAVLIPGGFGVRGVDGKIGAARWARENKVPTLGICLGLQVMVMEYARTILGLDRRVEFRV